MKVKLDKGALKPTRAHDTDAGLDLRTPIAFTMLGEDYAVIRTGVHIELPPGTAGVIMAKSGLNVIHNITCTGLIDEGYDGEIVVKLYRHGNWREPLKFGRGDKIAQLVVIPVEYVDVEIVDEISGGTRGSDGFGSSGR